MKQPFLGCGQPGVWQWGDWEWLSCLAYLAIFLVGGRLVAVGVINGTAAIIIFRVLMIILGTTVVNLIYGAVNGIFQTSLYNYVNGQCRPLYRHRAGQSRVQVNLRRWMMEILDQFSLLWVYLGTVVLVMVAAEIGFQAGRWLQRRDPDSDQALLTGPVIGGTLGLMAFLLGFCISIVIGQHNGRKAMVVTEANAIGTAYLRADFLDDDDRNATQDLLREYVEIRLASASDPTLYESVVARSGEIHNELWSIVKDATQGDQSALMALFVDSINEVIDVHSLRLAAVSLRLPRQLGIVLYVATLLSFLLVGISSSANGKRDTLTILLFAIAFVTVFMIIVDLDRAQEGLLTVSQTAMTDLLAQMIP